MPWLTDSIGKLWRTASDWSLLYLGELVGWIVEESEMLLLFLGGCSFLGAACVLCSLFSSTALCFLGTAGFVKHSQPLVSCFWLRLLIHVLRHIKSFFIDAITLRFFKTNVLFLYTLSFLHTSIASSSRSSIVRTPDLRTSWTPQRNSTKSSATLSKEHRYSPHHPFGCGWHHLQHRHSEALSRN